MQPHPRYQVLDQIAVGDFATVYRGKDLELNRDVAIKQIHVQFLADQRQLERYWQEAQLLASLEHPNIMTIYDIARDRGWLILELMQGSLKDQAAGQPMDLNFLRVALACALQALRFLHAKGIIHGDVKPSNLMLDKRNWVKLGDFGLAQRVVNDQGSLLKGTTKYMAPERVSDQFGPVGPQSDLYSLGFSIYELMCGDAFQTLFPGLEAFGRDQQIAWMMWQAAPDRQLPEIRRVLEGVPDDLIHVIQRLVIKDPKRRYQSADEAIRDLKSGLGYGAPQPTEQELAAQAAAAAEAVERKKKRRLLIVAACASLAVCGAMVAKDVKNWISPPPPIVENFKDVRGVIRSIHLDQNKVVLTSLEVVEFRPKDLVYLNDEVAKLPDVKIGDRVAVVVHKDANGRSVQEIRASRPQVTGGQLKSVHPREKTLVVTVGEDGPTARDVTIEIPDSVKLLFNGRPGLQGRDVTLADFTAGDRMVVAHEPKDKGRVATSVEAFRVVPLEGFVRGVDAKHNRLTISQESGQEAAQATWPLAPECEVTINRKKFLMGRPVAITDLRPGDEVSLRHDAQIISVAATRVVTKSGTLREIAGDGHTLSIQLDGETQPKPYIIDGETSLQLGDETVPITDLETGDTVRVRFDAADLAHPVALEVKAVRAIDRTRWAILVAEQSYRDARISPIAHPKGDVERLRDVLIKRYHMAPDQAVVIVDADHATLEQTLGAALNSVGQTAHLLVYVTGHAYRDNDGTAYLATSDAQVTELKQTALPLSRLFALVNACAAADKVLVLDTCQTGKGIDIPMELTPDKLVAQTKEGSEQPLLNTTTVITSCQEGQRGQVGVNGHALLADALALAFAGRGDANADHRITTAELFDYLTSALRSASSGQQSPVLIPPQKVIPPRLTPEGKQAIAQLAAQVLEERNNSKKLKELYQAALKAAPKQPEPRILYGLALLKDKQFQTEAATELQAARQEFPDQLVPIEGLVWSQFQRRTYGSGINGLTLLVSKLPRDKGGAIVVDRQTAPLLEWAGRLREFADTATADEQRPANVTLEKLDQAVEHGGEAAVSSYRRGQQHVRGVEADFDTKTSQATEVADKLKLNQERRRLSHYATFPFEAAVQSVLDGTRK